MGIRYQSLAPVPYRTITVWPADGMLGASLRFRGVELLRRVDDLDAGRIEGSTAGIPLLYPWANRLDSLQYRAAGRQVLAGFLVAAVPFRVVKFVVSYADAP